MNNSGITVPDNFGTSGRQERPTGEVLPAEPQTGLPFVDAIEKGLAASPRAPDEFGFARLAGAAGHPAGANYELKVENVSAPPSHSVA